MRVVRLHNVSKEERETPMFSMGSRATKLKSAQPVPASQQSYCNTSVTAKELDIIPLPSHLINYRLKSRKNGFACHSLSASSTIVRS